MQILMSVKIDVTVLAEEFASIRWEVTTAFAKRVPVVIRIKEEKVALRILKNFRYSRSF